MVSAMKATGSQRPSVDPRDLEIARAFARAFAAHCHPSAFEVRLFGSRARGEGDEESDLDLFVTLQEDDPHRHLREAALQIACDLTLEHGLLVSVLVADPTFLKRCHGYSFLEAVAHEGIRV